MASSMAVEMLGDSQVPSHTENEHESQPAKRSVSSFMT
jgi:hypothetical protein